MKSGEKMVKHEKGVPTHSTLKDEYDSMTPEEAQLAYEKGLITEKENKLFECSLKSDCHAPLTCQGMTKIGNTAFFVEGKRTKNLHIDECPFSEKSLKKKNSHPEKEQETTYEASGLIILDTKGGHFAKGLTLPSTTNDISESNEQNVDSTTETEQGPPKTVPTKNPENLPIKQRNKHMKDIGSFVSIYEENPDYIINKGFLGQNVPIKRYFRPIKENHIPRKVYDDVPVYYGIGFARATKLGDYEFSFSEGISINNKWYQAHFFVSPEFIDYHFPFIRDYCIRDRKTLNIYIESRFWFGKTNKGKDVLRFKERDENLTPLIYFTKRK